MESITKELREHATVSWDPWPEARGRLLQMCDRIDAEYEKAVRELNDYASDSVLLPRDADGEVIHIWDVLDPPADCNDYVPLQVVRLTYDGYEDEWFFDGATGGFTGMVGVHMDVAGWTHHHKQTVEDVLREIVHKCQPTYSKDGSYTTWLTEEEFAEYASRLRLAEDAE